MVRSVTQMFSILAAFRVGAGPLKRGTSKDRHNDGKNCDFARRVDESYGIVIGVRVGIDAPSQSNRITLEV